MNKTTTPGTKIIKVVAGKKWRWSVAERFRENWEDRAFGQDIKKHFFDVTSPNCVGQQEKKILL